ncbi:hypothetical protein Tco_0451724 [Tanacetum coccineum]
MINESLEHIVLAKGSSQPQSSYEAAATLTEFELKKILIDKMNKSESYLAAPEHIDWYEGLKKSYELDKTFFSTYDKVKSAQSEEPEFEIGDSDMPQDQEENLGNDNEEYKEKTPQQGQNQSWLMTLASSTNKPSKTFDELMSTPIDFSAFIMNDLKLKNLTQEILLGPPFKLLKGTRSNYVELEYDFEECYKALSEKLDWENPEGGDYPFDLTKTLPLVMSRNRQKAAQYDLTCIKDMVLDVWVPIKAAYDLHSLWGISHLREQHKTFYAYARGLQSRHDVYSMKRILVVTRVKVMRKHGYGYLKEIVVRRADNILYRFKEGDFPCLRINDIENMLIFVVQNQLINLSGDDIFDFAIALRMFTRSLVIQKRVKDLQLGVKSYQKKINITRPQTTISGMRKRDQTLTRLRTSLDDITKNIQMEYLPKRRWSRLEKKRSNIMIKAIDKQLKERRLIRSLKRFVGGRHYGTDLRLLQRTI